MQITYNIPKRKKKRKKQKNNKKKMSMVLQELDYNVLLSN